MPISTTIATFSLHKVLQKHPIMSLLYLYRTGMLHHVALHGPAVTVAVSHCYATLFSSLLLPVPTNSRRPDQAMLFSASSTRALAAPPRFVPAVVSRLGRLWGGKPPLHLDLHGPASPPAHLAHHPWWCGRVPIVWSVWATIVRHDATVINVDNNNDDDDELLLDDNKTTWWMPVGQIMMAVLTRLFVALGTWMIVADVMHGRGGATATTNTTTV